MKTIPASIFRANCLAILNEVKASRMPIVITKRGRPLAKLVPINTLADDIFGFFQGKGSITGDVLSPVLSLERPARRR